MSHKDILGFVNTIIYKIKNAYLEKLKEYGK
jgi:hypothetical protein